jgi:uncharacterized membrane protein
MDKPWGIIGQIAILIFLIVFAKLLHWHTKSLSAMIETWSLKYETFCIADWSIMAYSPFLWHQVFGLLA